MICAVGAAGCGSVGASGGDAGSIDTGGPGGGSTKTEVAPYYYAYGWGNAAYAFSSLTDMKTKGGPAEVSIGFVLAGTGCNVTTEIHDHLADVRAYVAAGGHVKASFGGATGTYLEYACTTAVDLAAALGRFVDDTGITDLDFDLEQHAMSSTPALNALRGSALKQLQAQKHVQISFTLPVTPGGMLPESVDIVQAAITAGVAISIVNALAMDFGDGTDLATAPTQATEAVAQQVHMLMPSLSLDQVYRHVGVTAMIGKNDDNETLTQANAHTLADYVRAKRLGLVAFWAVQRDQVCGAMTTDLGLCSRLDTQTFEFDAIFEAVNAP